MSPVGQHNAQDVFPMQFQFTPGALRALDLARIVARDVQAANVDPLHLLWALLLDESRASEILAGLGIRLETFRALHAFPEPLPASDTAADTALGELVETVLHEARRQVSTFGRSFEIGSEHLLFGLAHVDSPASQFLRQQGIQPQAIGERVAAHGGVSREPIEAEVRLALPQPRLSDTTDTYRILDAAANRAREGLRVVEDFVRFSLDDAHLSAVLKQCRHTLEERLSTIDPQALLASRDTQRDVGTDIHTVRERARSSPEHVVRASFKRVQEALRTLEEYSKVLSPDLGLDFGRLRYEIYTAEKAVLATRSSRDRLAGRDLYLLATEELCRAGSGPAIRDALAGGVGIVQVREKHMPDRKLLEHACRVREWTHAAGALFLMNDRPDLALLAEADGVHVGQDELQVREARRIVGPERLVGVSTHTIEQARQAVLDGADYIGVGPVFSTPTKNFTQLAGLDFVRQVAAEITLPWYAIGGINLETVESVVEAGARRVAVSGALCGAADHEQVARELLAALRRLPV